MSVAVAPGSRVKRNGKMNILNKKNHFLPSTNYELWIQIKGNETINFDLRKFGNFCHRPPLLMFAPADENLATPLITTSGILVGLYRRFGVYYVSLV